MPQQWRFKKATAGPSTLPVLTDRLAQDDSRFRGARWQQLLQLASPAIERSVSNRGGDRIDVAG